LHESLLFALCAADAGADMSIGRETRGFEQPTAQDGLPREAIGFARQDDENRLRAVLRQMRVAHLPQRGGIDERKVPFDERGEGRLGTACVFLQ